MTEEEKAFLDAGYHYYSVKFDNLGGLVMPIILEFQFVDGTSEIVRVPVQIWQKNNEHISKIFFFEKEVEKIVLDPLLETADTDRDNFMSSEEAKEYRLIDNVLEHLDAPPPESA